MTLRHACAACAEAVAAWVALSMSDSRGGLTALVAATDKRSEELEELQSTIGEGPGHDVVHGQAALLVPDLSSVDATMRWPVFTQVAATAGVRAMFALPVRAGAAGLGVLDLYRFRPGPLTDDELADALSYADAALALTLDLHAGAEAQPERAADRLLSRRRAIIHQASGMVSVQLGVSVAEALVRLRAHAFATDSPLADVAAEVVARALRFDTPPPDG